MSYLKSSLKLKITVFLIITALIFWLIPSNFIFAEEGQDSEEEIVSEETSDSSEESLEEEVAEEEVTEEEETEGEVTEETTGEEEQVGEETEGEDEETAEEIENEEPADIENSGGSTEGEITDEEATEEELADEEVLPEEELLEGEEADTEVVEVEEIIAATPTLSTDKVDYMPEDTVLVSGSGYEAGETLLIRVIDPNGSIEEDFLFVNSDGSISYSYNLVNGIMATYHVQIIDPETNEALSQCSFTDESGEFLYVGPSRVHTTIQSAIAVATEGTTIIVDPGTYPGNVIINIPLLNIFGPNKDIIPNTGTQVEEATVDGGGLAGNVFNVNADGVTINGFTITNGYNGIAGETSDSNFIYNIIYGNLNIGGSNGVGISLWGDNDNNTISNNEIYNNDRQGVFIGYQDSTKISSNNTVSDNVIHDNGLYINPNGPDASAYGVQLWNADNNIIENNEIYGHDDWFPYPVTSPTYDFAQGIYLCGSFNNIVTENNLHDNNYGVGLYSYGRTPVGTNQITSNNISDNTGFGIRNIGSDAVTVNATGNWWGSTTGPYNAATNPLGIGNNAVSNNVDYSPWWGSDYIGAAHPWTWYLNTSNGSTIQEGINAASAGDTINVGAGTYNESVKINKDNLTITGDFASNPVITGGLRFDTNLASLMFSNFNVSGNAVVGENSIVRMFGVIRNLFIDNCIFNGENILNRSGFTGGQIEGNLTVTNSEFMNILGWAVFDTRSGSGGDGSAMDTVIFSNNNIHDCNGSVVLRGLSTDKTDKVDIYGNTFQNIGGNQGLKGEQWAAFEVNHSILANIYDNIIKNVSEGEWGEGQAIQLWDIDILDVHNNTITDNYQGIYIFRGNAGGLYGGPYAIPGGSIYENLISGNSQYGISVQSATGGLLNAENNWWGDTSGPYNATLNIAGKGDVVSNMVDFNPWLIGRKQEFTESGPITIDAKNDVGVEVEKTGTGTPIITVYKYSENPGSGFSNDLGIYTDLHIDDATGVDLIVFRMYYTDADVATAGLVETSLKARFWTGSDWVECTEQTVNTVDNYIEVTITLTTKPKISDLVGTAFAASGNPPVTPVTPTPAATTVAQVSAPVKVVAKSTTPSPVIEVLGIQELPFTGMNPLIPISGISTIFAGGLMVALSAIRKRLGKK